MSDGVTGRDISPDGGDPGGDERRNLSPSRGKRDGGLERSGRHRLSLSSIAWRATQELSFEEWAEQGRRLGVMGRAAGWWVGDWLTFGNLAYGERYARASRITGYDVQTLMNMAYVASRFDVSRRREALSWSHHAELAALPPDEQDRWLDQAEADRFSVRCLREALRTERRAERALENGGEEKPEILHAAHADADIVCPACGHSFVEEQQPESSEA
jgi:hypothetical protein